MSQAFTEDFFASGHVAQTDMQAAANNFAALRSCFSGSSSPPNTEAGMWWFDTTSNILKMRDEADSNWLSVWDLANNKPFIANLSNEITGAMISSAIKDAAAGTASLRTLGTSSVQAAAGNDSRFSGPTSGTAYKIFTIDDTVRVTSQGGDPIGGANWLAITLERHYDNDSHYGCIAMASGTVTAYAQHKMYSAGVAAYIRVLKRTASTGATAIVNSWTTSSTSWQTRTQNISVVPGDEIIWQQTAWSLNKPSSWRYLRVYSGTLTPGVSW